jgi:hypothetical protein
VAYEKRAEIEMNNDDLREFMDKQLPVPEGKEVAIRSNVSVNDTRALVKAIAMDIGKEVVAYVEVHYPQAIEATSSTFKLSLRNCIYNEIMAAIDVSDEGQIIARLRDRKSFRRKWTAAWRKIRGNGPSAAREKP